MSVLYVQEVLSILYIASMKIWTRLLGNTEDIFYRTKKEIKVPNSIWGGGQNCPYNEKISKKCPGVPNNNTSLVKQISLFHTASVMTKT